MQFFYLLISFFWNSYYSGLTCVTQAIKCALTLTLKFYFKGPFNDENYMQFHKY